ncbi:MAG: HAD family hydrolase [Desulforhopalus sp.]
MGYNSLQAIFFDFDGVIVQSTSIKTEAFRTLFNEYDNNTIQGIVDYHRLHGGISRVVKIDHAHRNIIGKPLDSVELERWAARYRALVIEEVIKVDWIAGAEQSLRKLAQSVPLFVISGTPEEELIEVVERRDMRGFFQETLGSPTKKPTHIRRLLSKYSLTPNRCVFIGDALTDYDAAKETGLHFVGILGEVAFPDGTIVLPDCSLLCDTLIDIFSK